MQSFLTATAHFALFLVPCLLTTVVHLFTTTSTDSTDLVG
jgi:hypothetical protein